MERTTEAAEKLYARGVMALQRALRSHLQAAGSAGSGG